MTSTTELDTLRVTAAAMKARLDQMASNPETNTFFKAKLDEVEASRSQLRTEITELYKEKANLAQRTLDLTQTVDRLRKEIAEQKTAYDAMAARNHDLELKLSVVNDHHAQLQVELLKADDKIKELQNENQQCVTQLLNAKSREAEQLNMAKDLYDSLLRRMRKEDVDRAIAQAGPQAGLLHAALPASTAIEPNVRIAVPSRPHRSFVGHDAEVNAIAYNPTGAQIVTASSDRRVRIWDAESGGAILTLDGSDKGASTCCFSDNEVAI